MSPTSRTLAEAALVAAAGLLLGLGSNAAREDNLELGRNYFPSSPLDVAAAAPTGGAPADAAPPQLAGATGTAPSEIPTTPPDAAGTEPQQDALPALSELDEEELRVRERLAAKGLVAIGHAEAVAAHADPMFGYGAIVFIDARREVDYAEGHIPGAWHLDPFYAERYQQAMLELLPASMQVIVYCNGGDCEDSESAAQWLLAWGADPGRLVIYTGGITAWTADGRPIERGERGSGDVADDAR